MEDGLRDGQSLYEALGVERNASPADLRRAYLKLAAALHPDKNLGAAAATGRFQTLQKVYAILGDAEKRRVYDATGSVAASEELTGDSFADLRRYYREVYAPVTPEAVDAFYLAYRGGAEERADLLREYAAAAGDMGRVFARVMCSDEAADARRFMDTIEAAIAGGEAERHARYARWAARVAKAPRPADPLGAAGVSGSGGASGSGAAPGAKGKGRKKAAAAGGDVDLALVAQLQARRSAVGGAFLDALAAKYGAPPAGAGEPSEAEFAAAAACVTARAKGKGKGKAGEGGGKAAAPKRAKKG